MRQGPSGRRVAAVWLPYLATDMHRRSWTEPRPAGSAALEDGAALVAVTVERGRRILAAVDAAGRTAGLVPGMTLADARAMEPSLVAFDADVAAMRRCRDRLAAWATRYTPWAAADGDDGIVLDITGCAHLFDGEAGLVADLVARLAAAGLSARAGVADTPAAAWALARFATRAGRPVRLVAAGDQRQALAELPVAALRLPGGIVDALRGLGLRRIGDLYPLPRATLAPRFGTAVGVRLDQALGASPEPISPLSPPIVHTARLAFAEPISTAPAIEAAIHRLLDDVCRGLALAGMGARRLVLTVYRADLGLDGAPAAFTVGTHRPVRDPAALSRLFADTTGRIDPGPGLDVMTLAASVVDPLAATAIGLDGGGAGEALAVLLDRLGNRLGDGTVFRLIPRQSWLPERAVIAAAADVTPSQDQSWPADRPRPVRLLSPPEPIEATAPVPDDPPLMFRWRGALHRVRRADGPERIAAEWWRRDDEPRDYYRVEDSEGERFWVYRRGVYRPDVAAAWFLHGMFG